MHWINSLIGNCSWTTPSLWFLSSSPCIILSSNDISRWKWWFTNIQSTNTNTRCLSSRCRWHTIIICWLRNKHFWLDQTRRKKRTRKKKLKCPVFVPRFVCLIMFDRCFYVTAIFWFLTFSSTLFLFLSSPMILSLLQSINHCWQKGELITRDCRTLWRMSSNKNQWFVIQRNITIRLHSIMMKNMKFLCRNE